MSRMSVDILDARREDFLNANAFAIEWLRGRVGDFIVLEILSHLTTKHSLVGLVSTSRYVRQLAKAILLKNKEVLSYWPYQKFFVGAIMHPILGHPRATEMRSPPYFCYEKLGKIHICQKLLGRSDKAIMREVLKGYEADLEIYSMKKEVNKRRRKAAQRAMRFMLREPGEEYDESSDDEFRANNGDWPAKYSQDGKLRYVKEKLDGCMDEHANFSDWEGEVNFDGRYLPREPQGRDDMPELGASDCSDCDGPCEFIRFPGATHAEREDAYAESTYNGD
jgi:hypothetical protein